MYKLLANEISRDLGFSTMSNKRVLVFHEERFLSHQILYGKS